MADGQPIPQSGSDRGKANPILIASTAVFFLLTVILFALWTQERNKPTVVKTVDVEKIKEVPVEKIKQVERPAKLTEDQKFLIDLGSKLLNSRELSKSEDALYKIPAFNLVVSVDTTIKGEIDADRITDKLELALRRNRIKIDSNAPVSLVCSVNALWNDPKTMVSTLIELAVSDRVTIARNGDFRRTSANIFERNMFGYAGKSHISEHVFQCVDQLSDNFANKYLAAQEAEEKNATTQNETSN